MHFRHLPIVRQGLLRISPLMSRTYILPDPTTFETPLLPTTLTIALDERNRGCLVRHEGLGGVTGKNGAKVISEVWAAAEERVKQLRDISQESLE
jgi:exosome complex component RRP43